MSGKGQKRLYCDESGFTGYNLLDPAQPCFVVASTDLEPDRSEKILRNSFRGYRGAEFKSSNLWKAKDKSGYIEFARQIRGACDRIFIYTSNKRFVVLTKAIDFLVEPIISSAGYDFYADDFARRYVNYIHFGFEQFAPDIHQQLLREYQYFSRNPTRTALAQTYRKLQEIFAEAPDEVKIFGEQILAGLAMFEQFHDFDQFRSSSDIHLSTMVAVVGYWRGLASEDFEVVHDDSAHFFRNSGLWDNITDPRVEERLHPTAVGPDIQFPLRVTQTTPCDSKSNHSIQLCDVIAGLSARYAQPPESDETQNILNQILEAGFGDIPSNSIRPTTEFPKEIPPRPLTGPDAVDRMTSIIRESQAKGPRK